MIRLISCVLVYSTLTAAFPFPYPAAPVIPPVVPTAIPLVPGSTPVVPNTSPFVPGARPIVPGVNNPYYNYAGGPAVPILSYSSEHGLDGNYAFSFSTADGKQAQESGYLKDAYIDNDGNPQGTQVVQGSYAYISPDGTPIQVTYVADENGFRPSGVHIPADGKAVAPIVPVVDREKQIFDPNYNRYNPYLNRNGYDNLNRNGYNTLYRNGYDNLNRNGYNTLNRNGFNNNFGQYNNRAYDPRYPYDSTRFNPYYNINPYKIGDQNKNVKDEAKN